MGYSPGKGIGKDPSRGSHEPVAIDVASMGQAETNTITLS